MYKSKFSTALVLIFLLIICLIATSCKSISEAKRLSQCEYAFTRVTNTELGGVKIQGKQGFRDLSFSQMALLTTAFISKQLDLTLTANVLVRNPNKKMAAINNLEWILLVEGEEIAQGVIDKRFEVGAGETQTLSVNVRLDVVEIWKSKNRDSILNLLFNLSDVGGKPTLLTMKIKPSIMIAGKLIKTPNYFTVNKEFGE